MINLPRVIPTSEEVETLRALRALEGSPMSLREAAQHLQLENERILLVGLLDGLEKTETPKEVLSALIRFMLGKYPR